MTTNGTRRATFKDLLRCFLCLYLFIHIIVKILVKKVRLYCGIKIKDPIVYEIISTVVRLCHFLRFYPWFWKEKRKFFEKSVLFLPSPCARCLRGYKRAKISTQSHY